MKKNKVKKAKKEKKKKKADDSDSDYDDFDKQADQQIKKLGLPSQFSAAVDSSEYMMSRLIITPVSPLSTIFLMLLMLSFSSAK